MNEFMECAACASKGGTPVLCQSCLHNRARIGELQERIDELLDVRTTLRVRLSQTVRREVELLEYMGGLDSP